MRRARAGRAGDPGRCAASTSVDYRHQQRRLAEPDRRALLLRLLPRRSLRSCGLRETPLPVPDIHLHAGAVASGRRARRRRGRAREEGLIGRCCASFSLAAAVALASRWPAAPALAATTQAPLKDVALVVRGPVRHVRPGPAAARLQGLHGGLLAVPLDAAWSHFRNLGDPGGPFWNPKYPNPNDNPYVKAIAARLPGRRHRLRHRRRDPARRPTSADCCRRRSRTTRPPGRPTAARCRPTCRCWPRRAKAGRTTSIRSSPAYRPTAGRPDRAARQVLRPRPSRATCRSYWNGDPNAVPTGGFIAMPPPLTAQGHLRRRHALPAVDQEAKDVAAFLQWASDPKMEERKQTRHRGDDLPGDLLRPALRQLPLDLAQRRALTARPGAASWRRPRRTSRRTCVARPRRGRRSAPMRVGGRSSASAAGSRLSDAGQPAASAPAAPADRAARRVDALGGRAGEGGDLAGKPHRRRAGVDRRRGRHVRYRHLRSSPGSRGRRPPSRAAGWRSHGNGRRGGRATA